MRKDWTKELKYKLSEYSERPSDAVWEKIAARAGIVASDNVKDNFHRVAKMAAAVCAVAACFVAAFILWDKDVDETGIVVAEKNSHYITDASASPQNSRPSANTQIDIHTNKAPNSFNDTKEYHSRNTTREVPPEKESTQTETPLIFEPNSEIEGAANSAEVKSTEVLIEEKSIEANLADADLAEVNSIEANSEEADVKVAHQESEDSLIDMDEYLKLTTTKKKPEGKRLSLGLSVGSSSNVSGLKLVENDYAYGNPLVGAENSSNMLWASSEAEDYTGILRFEQPAIDENYNHRLPIKFGISAQYKINKTFGIESGLMWTILSSDISAGSKDKSYRTGSQSLHYIGVPLNLTANIFSAGPVNIYLSGGGAVEKCIKGSRNIEEYEYSKYINTVKTSVCPKELQWSANLGAGIQINLPGNFGLFAEPMYVHRFSNGSNVSSAYTEKPNDFSLKFGLRYILD